MLANGACRVAILLLGYVYPVYCTFKALERRKPDGVRGWCEYWYAAGGARAARALHLAIS